METITIAELVASLGFDVDEEGIDSFGDAIGRLGSIATAVATAVAGAAAASFAWAQSAANAGDEAAKNALRLGLTVEAYQELDHAAQLSGTSIEEMSAGLRRFAATVDRAAQGGTAQAEVLERIGVETRNLDGTYRDVDAILLDVSDRFATMEAGIEQTALAQELFGRGGSAMLPLLSQGADGIEAMRQEARDLGIVLSAEATARAEEFNDSMFRLSQMATGLKNEVGVALMPVIIEIAERVQEWFVANRELIASGLEGFMTGVARTAFGLIERLVDLVGWFERTIESVGGLQSILAIARIALIGFVGFQVFTAFRSLVLGIRAAIAAYRLLGITAAISQAAALAMPLAIAAAIAFVVLAIQDFVTFMQGGESVIGDFVERFAEAEGPLGMIARGFLWLREHLPGILAEAALIIGELWRGMRAGAERVWGFIGPFVVRAVEGIADAFGRYLAFVVSSWGTIAEAAQIVWGGVSAFVSDFVEFAGPIIAGFVSLVVSYWSFIGEAWSAVSSGIVDAVGFIGEVFSTVFSFVRDTASSVFEFIFDGIAGTLDALLGLAQQAGDTLGINTGGIARARSSLDGLRETISNDGAATNASLDIATRTSAARQTSASLSTGDIVLNFEGSNLTPNEVREVARGGLDSALQDQLSALSRAVEGGEA